MPFPMSNSPVIKLVLVKSKKSICKGQNKKIFFSKIWPKYRTLPMQKVRWDFTVPNRTLPYLFEHSVPRHTYFDKFRLHRWRSQMMFHGPKCQFLGHEIRCVCGYCYHLL